MSQADEYLRHRDPVRAAMRPGRQGADAWADLRPAARWLQRRRPVLVSAILLIALQVVWRAPFLGHMYFYRQDFFNLDYAISSRFSWHYLTYVGTGHLMIGQRAIIWVLTRISLYSWTLASAVTMAFLAGAGLAAFRALRTLFGERPAILVPLAVYLLSPLGIADVGWWTVALESLPLQLAMCMALSSHIHYVRTKRRRHLTAACFWVIFGLLAFEKGLVVPVLLFAVTSAYFMGGRSWLSGAVLALRRYWGAWLIYAAALVAYAVVLATSLKTSTSKLLVPTAPGVAKFSWGLLKWSLVPGAVGGPWRWLPLPGRAYALADPPSELTWLALFIAVAVVGASILRQRIAWRAWMIFATWVVLADMLPVIIARLNWYPVLLALDTRYVADAMPVLAVCIGLVFLPVVFGTEGADSPANARAAANVGIDVRLQANPPDHVWRTAAVGLLAVLFVGSVWSASSYQSLTTGQPAASYIANGSLAVNLAPKGTLVLDAPVPDQVKDSTNGARAVIGVIQPGKLTWIERPSGTMDGLRIFGPDGRLYSMWIHGATSGRGPVRGCWPQKHHSISVKFVNQPPYWTTLLRIGYFWASAFPGVVNVRYGATVRQISVTPGLHSAYLPVTGTSSGIHVTGLGNMKMCIGDAEAGNPEPFPFGTTLPATSSR